MSAPIYDVKGNCIRVKGGGLYLPVAQRLVWFRLEHPDWGILTAPLEINMTEKYAIWQATITNAEGRVIAMATKQEDAKGFGDWLEKAETGAVGRALAYCGYGTQFEPALCEGEDVCDGPVKPAAGQFIGGNDPLAEFPLTQEFSSAAATSAKVLDVIPVVCSEASCGASMTQGQASVSMGRYMRYLCPACQKKQSGAARPPTMAANSQNGASSYAHVQ